jgi:hypothetical protein
LNYATIGSANVTVGQSPVTYSSESSDKVFGIWFSFDADRPSNIYWDPTLSTSVYEASSGSTMMIHMAMLMMVALIFA